MDITEIKKLEAELQAKKNSVINELLKQREELDKQLAELGWTKPKQTRAKRKKA